MKRIILAVAISTMLFGAIGARSVSARGGGGGASCSITPAPAVVGQPFTVTATGLPTNSPIYLWIGNFSGSLTSSYVGTTSTGKLTLSETGSFASTWSYQFTGPYKTKGTAIYATCSVSVD